MATLTSSQRTYLIKRLGEIMSKKRSALMGELLAQIVDPVVLEYVKLPTLNLKARMEAGELIWKSDAEIAAATKERVLDPSAYLIPAWAESNLTNPAPRPSIKIKTRRKFLDALAQYDDWAARQKVIVMDWIMLGGSSDLTEQLKKLDDYKFPAPKIV